MGSVRPVLFTVDQTIVLSLVIYQSHVNKIEKEKNTALVRAWERRGSEHIVVQMLLKQRGGTRAGGRKEGGRERAGGGRKGGREGREEGREL